jgi:hypothetical protein
VPLVPVIVNV